MIWCLGMHASGSTWVFNAALKVAACLCPERPIVGRYVTRREELDFPSDPAVLAVIKSHDTDEAAAAELARRCDAVLLGPRPARLRHVADALPGVSTGLGSDDGRAGRPACLRLAADRRAVLLRYEDGFIDKPGTSDRIAAIFGQRLAPDARACIFAETRRAAVERHIAGLAALPTALLDAASGDVVDTATKWHRHHAGRSGEIGRWRHMLTMAAAIHVEDHLSSCMAALGYPMAILPLISPVGAETLRL